MNVQGKDSSAMPSAWSWPIDKTSYDRSPVLTDAERQEIAFLASRKGGSGKKDGTGGLWPQKSYQVLHRLIQPLFDVLWYVDQHFTHTARIQLRSTTVRVFVIEMHRRQTPYWAWDESACAEFVAPTLEHFNLRLGYSWKPTKKTKPRAGARLRTQLALYLLGILPNIRACGDAYPFPAFARLAFGEQRVQQGIDGILAYLHSIGYATTSKNRNKIIRAMCVVFLLNKSPLLEDLTEEHLRQVYETTPHLKYQIAIFSRALAALGYLRTGIAKSAPGLPALGRSDGTVTREWEEWCQEWRKMTTVEPSTRDNAYRNLLMIGRWLKQEHPEISSPAQWTATLATECVAMISHLTIGQYVRDQYRFTKQMEPNVGKPVKPRTICAYLTSVRCFFRDLQESEKIPLAFNPHRYLVAPRSVKNKIGPDPRVIDRPLWAKLVWAGQHLEGEDIPSAIYPLAFVRAVAAVWLFTALRSDEICRLHLGCIEWPATDILDPETGKKVSKEAFCYLHIPANKTAPAFKKPIAPYVGKMIAAWEHLRPPQEPVIDRKDAELVSYLFSLRGRRLGHDYLNTILIPLLAAKANVQPLDQRGRITSHRARATIASFLGNCENPMSLSQLMHWLGHRTAQTTRSYVNADLTKVAVKVAEGSFLQQNLASIPVVIDNNAVVSGAASQGQPWKYFDLGHGYCMLPEWGTCRHRMACAKCDFYEPKQSSKMLLLEANGNLTRMLEFITLGDEERKLVEQGMTLNQSLLSRLVDEPTPAGPTPHELHAGKRRLLPVLTETVGLVESERILNRREWEEDAQIG